VLFGSKDPSQGENVVPASVREYPSQKAFVKNMLEAFVKNMLD